MQYDVLILGRGLAGAVLAEACMQRGLKAHVFDHKRTYNASMAAAGMVNPLVLRRDVLGWRAAQLMPLVGSFYSTWQARLGIPCWHRMPVVKIFPTAHEVAQWQRAMENPATAPFTDRPTEPEIDAAPFRAPHGYGTVTMAGWLDVPLLLSAQRGELLRYGLLTEGEVADGDIERTSDGIRIGHIEGRWLVRCTGPFAELPGLIPVKGETATVRSPGLQLSRMVHRGIFMLPLGEERFRIGATFEWDDVWSGPAEAAHTWLLERLTALLDAPVEVLERQVGVRPTTKDRRPIAGATQDHEAVLNGLGSRGVMQAPWCAGQLLDHLFSGKRLDPEIDHLRFA